MYDLVKHQYVVLIVSDSTELVMTEKFFHWFYSLIFTNVGDKNNALQGTCTLHSNILPNFYQGIPIALKCLPKFSIERIHILKIQQFWSVILGISQRNF